MSSNSPNTNKKITSSFSSPESIAGIESSVLSTESNLDSAATSASEATKIVKSYTSAEIRHQSAFNTITRDSGFSDSITEDSSSFSNYLSNNSNRHPGLLIARTEHILTLSNPTPEMNSTDITLVTKCFSEKNRLKSVEEDIDIVNTIKNGETREEDKEFITIVKTTKYTTKVEKVKSAKSAKVKSKKQKSKISKHLSEEAKESSGGAESQEESASPLNNQSSSPTLFQININKSTEELVFQTLPSPSALKQDIDLSASNEAQQVVDLNSTVLDCEDILSTYSSSNHQALNNPSSPGHLETSDQVVPDSINEIVNVVDVLSDVTHVLLSQSDAKQDVDETKENVALRADFKADKKKKV